MLGRLNFLFTKTVKANKEECMRLTERVYQVICAIINLTMDSKAELPPALTRGIVGFYEYVYLS